MSHAHLPGSAQHTTPRLVSSDRSTFPETARRAYAVRRIDPAAFAGLATGAGVTPRPGDVLLARVERVGDPDHLDLATGRTGALFEGDEIVVAYGEDLSHERFEAYVPSRLVPCHLVASGGVAALIATAHDHAGTPTVLTPIGLVTDGEGAVLNLSDFALAPCGPLGPLPPVIACVGTALRAGATRAVSRLVRGLERAGSRVGVARVTGAASGAERWLLRDAGAEVVADCTDAGHASTAALDVETLNRAAATLVANLRRHLLDVIVLDFAHPLTAPDTQALLRSRAVAELADGALIAADESSAAAGAARMVEVAGIPVIAFSGTLARSPLAVRDATRATGLPCLRFEELAQARRAESLFADVCARLTGVAA
jgi:hypothetical protein